MAITSLANVHLENGEMITVTSNKTPMTHALEHLKTQILDELDNAYSDWKTIDITINRS